MTFVNLLKDIIDSAKERIKTPISGAFIWSFILWNWRPIFLLLYSDAPIEDKIVVINNEYCSFWALFFPLCLAFFYILVVPKIMVEINKNLEPTKKKRVDDYYGLKQHSAEKKKGLASVEYQLQNILSGNKQIEDYVEEIKSLKEKNEILQESIKEINETNRITIEEINDSLREVNKKYSQLLERYSFKNLHNTIIDETITFDTTLVDEILRMGDNLTFNEYKILKSINKNNEEGIFFKKEKNSFPILSSLSSNKILTFKSEENNYKVTFTEIGAMLLDIIKINK